MNQHKTPAVAPLAGYLDRLSVRPGQRVAVKTSSERPGTITAHVIRIWNADCNPDGMGVQTEAVGQLDLGTFPARQQKVCLGSWGWAPVDGLFLDPVLFVRLRYQPWLVREQGGVLVSVAGQEIAPVWSLIVTPTGLELRSQNAEPIKASIEPKRKKWYEVELRFDMRSGLTDLTVHSLDKRTERKRSRAVCVVRTKRSGQTLFCG